MPCKHTLCHTFVTNVALFNCVYISNVLLQNICCVELSITDVTVGLVFLVVFSVVLAETTSTAEFFSTIGTLVFNVHGSKSRVTTEEFDNIQNSEYYRFLTDSVNISMVVYGKSVWDSKPPRT